MVNSVIIFCTLTFYNTISTLVLSLSPPNREPGQVGEADSRRCTGAVHICGRRQCCDPGRGGRRLLHHCRGLGKLVAWLHGYTCTICLLWGLLSTSVVHRARLLYCSVRLRMESLSKLVVWAPQSTLVSNRFTQCVYTPPPPPFYGQYQFFFVFTVHIVLGVVKSSVSPMEYVVCMYEFSCIIYMYMVLARFVLWECYMCPSML